MFRYSIVVVFVAVGSLVTSNLYAHEFGCRRPACHRSECFPVVACTGLAGSAIKQPCRSGLTICQQQCLAHCVDDMNPINCYDDCVNNNCNLYFCVLPCPVAQPAWQTNYPRCRILKLLNLKRSCR